MAPTRKTIRLGTGLLALATASSSLYAFQVTKDNLSFRLNTDIGVGVVVRTEEPDKDLIGRANGGNAFSVNSDDGTQNFDRGDLGIAAFKRCDSRPLRC